MSADPLTPLQWAVLRAMARQTSSFYLSGGAALAGFHLRHRPTTDLDLFTLDGAAIDTGLAAVRVVAVQLGGRAVVRQQSPGFVRVVVDTGTDAVVVDLVHDPVAQLHPDKELRDGVRVDPLDEILVNTLTALVDRQEERDLVDVWFIEQRGLRVEDHLASAEAKDGGCTPSTLAWLLTGWPIPPDARLPPPLSSTVLREYRDQLVDRLTRAARPT